MRNASPTSVSVSGHWFWAIAAVAIGLFGAVFLSYGVLDRRAMLSSGEHAAREIAEHTALTATAALDANRQLLRAMAILATHSPSPPSARGTWVRSELLKLKAGNPDIMDLLIIDANGQIAHWTGEGPPPVITDREYYAYHARVPGSGLYIGDPLLSKVHKDRWFFPVSEALRDETGRLRHVVAAIIDMAMMHDLVGVRTAIPDSTQVLVSNDGKIYTRNPDHDLNVGKQVALPDEVASRVSGRLVVTVSLTSPLDRRERIVSFRQLQKYPLVAVGSVDIASVLGPWRQRMALIASLWAILSLTIVWLARRAREISRIQAELADIDALTGIHNRRSILHTAAMIERSPTHAGNLCLLMIDVDHFKSINDRFGHQAGDDVLRRVSDTIRENLRATDVIGRYGGEEFLVIMPDTGPEGAIQAAEKIRAAVAGKVRQPTPVTISIGVAALRRHDASFDEAQARADAALYAAKAGGRNCVRAADCIAA